MIRLILIWNAVLTVLFTILLVGYLHDRLHKTPIQASSTQADVIRVRRIELVDRDGRLTAVLGKGPDNYFPASGLTLLDPNGRKAVMLGLNNRGYGTFFFDSKRKSGAVEIGYFTGSDQVAPLSEEDPGAGWGIRVQRPGFEAPQVFGVQGDGRPIPTSR